MVESVLQVARARSEALVHKDVEAMSRILADEFMYINARGRMLTKQEYIENYLRSPNVQWGNQTIEEVQVQLYGDTALLYAKVHDVVTFSGHVIDAHFQSLFVYQRDATDAWRCIAGQSTAIS